MPRRGLFEPMAHFVIAATAAAVLVPLGSPALAAPAATRSASASAPTEARTFAPAEASRRQLTAAGSKSLVFGHQSVGVNILNGVGLLYRQAGMSPPAHMTWGNSSLPSNGAYVADAQIGRNGDPVGKIAAFESLLGKTSAAPDFALMKLCYVDIRANTNVKAIFKAYRSAMSRIRAANPGTVILHATVPLTTASPADNLKRQQYNALIRKTYKASRIVDIAKAESTTPSGSRTSGKYRGTRYYTLYKGYTSDGAHLNGVGSAKVAEALVAAMSK